MPNASTLDEWVIVVGEAGLRSLVVDALQQVDSSVKCSSTIDTTELASLVENRQVNLVVFDLGLTSDPEAFLEAFEQDYPDVPVLLVSGTRKVREAVEIMRKGAFHVLPTPVDPDELSRVLMLGQEVARSRRELQERKRIMRRDLEMAQHIQLSLLPPREMAIPGGAIVSTRHIPAEILGGDFFDVAPLGDKHIGMMMADVSGHGVSASLVVVVLKTLLLNAAPFMKAPAKFLENMNSQLMKIIPESFYLTCFYGILNTSTGHLGFASCGHPAPFLLRKSGRIERLESRGFFLGLDPRLDLEQKASVLKEGDRVVLFTDGVTDRRVKDSEPFGIQRLQYSIVRHADSTASQLLDRIIEDLRNQAGDRLPEDDIALMCVEYRPEEGSKGEQSALEDAVGDGESSALTDLAG
jgi:sigma-B regulation protein RsbU (phosphoserine phosphatase)